MLLVATVGWGAGPAFRSGAARNAANFGNGSEDAAAPRASMRHTE